MSQILVQIGAGMVLAEVRTKRKPCKCLAHKALQSEADGTRTRNPRIDSPIL